MNTTKTEWDRRCEARDEVIPLLGPNHISYVKHGLTFGWEEYTETLSELEDWGLMKGEWMGSLDYPARPMWSPTILGRDVLEKLKI